MRLTLALPFNPQMASICSCSYGEGRCYLFLWQRVQMNNVQALRMTPGLFQVFVSIYSHLKDPPQSFTVDYFAFVKESEIGMKSLRVQRYQEELGHQ